MFGPELTSGLSQPSGAHYFCVKALSYLFIYMGVRIHQVRKSLECAKEACESNRSRSYVLAPDRRDDRISIAMLPRSQIHEDSRGQIEARANQASEFRYESPLLRHHFESGAKYNESNSLQSSVAEASTHQVH